MADGSSEDRPCPKHMKESTFSVTNPGLCDTKKCSDEPLVGDRVNLSFYVELGSSDSCEKIVSRGVVADRSAVDFTNSQKSSQVNSEESEDRKKRCFDRYDSFESSDSGVAVLSPQDSSVCSGSDVPSPESPCSPESGCSTGSEGGGEAGAARGLRPPWQGPPAATRRLPAPPAPTRRPQPHRRITEFFSHKMKPPNGLKRESTTILDDDTKRKCLPKNGVTHDLEKYISYLSQTLNPKVLVDVGKTDAARKMTPSTTVAAADAGNGVKVTEANKSTHIPVCNQNGVLDFSKLADNKTKPQTTLNGSVDNRKGLESMHKEKLLNGVNSKRQSVELNVPTTPSANGTINIKKPELSSKPINLNSETRIAPAISLEKKVITAKPDSTKMNGVVSSTTKLHARMNGVTCGSNNLNLNSIACKQSPTKKESPKKPITTQKRTNRKSSACLANLKNLTWSKANNLKQTQLQKQNCASVTQSSPVKGAPGEASTAPKMTIPNGVRQVSMTVNGNLGTFNTPVTNLQNCHQINIPQPCNGTVTSNNLPSFVAVPQNVMLTTLRIPQNGLSAQTINQPNNINAFNRTNVNVSSPTKLNGSFVFPMVQNYNGAVVQIPNLMHKMPNFVIPPNSHLTTQRQDHLQNQQAAQILINGTLLKLANTMTTPYGNVNKPIGATSQSIPVMNKNVTAMPTVGMTVQPKPNFTVNLSHSVLVPQPGFIVTSVPNINVKETWSYTGGTNTTSSQTTCSNPIVQHPPPIVGSFTTPTLHSSSIPIAPVKPPDNPIQGTDPPSSTVKEPEISESVSKKCDIPWLSKTVNNNIVPLDSKMPMRPFASVSSSLNKFNEFKESKLTEEKQSDEKEKMETRKETTSEELRKVEEVARREDTIFTQITVLKDVSSNVQNTVIEANFSSATTESSESGIGTDKSVASPSDSQTSKEDEDSSLSLSVSVCSVEAQSCQKSPILKQPKTLRFPPRSAMKPDSDRRTSSTDTTNTVTVCLWENCKKEFDSDCDLLEHLQSVHVDSQAGRENYVCQWERCKVRGKPSCSRLWLERHALSHGGNKPFKCIVDGCERRFSTQTLLERHVNHHFTEVSPNAGSSKKTSESGAAKLIRRNGKKLRYRRQPWSARMFDFFDAGTMEGLAWRLWRCTRWRLGGACPLREPTGRHTLTLLGALTATRYNATHSRREALITYYPPHVLEDEWVPEKDVQRVKRVEIASLPARVKVALYEQFCASYRAAPSPPAPPRAPTPPPPQRQLPVRHCASSRLLNNLLAKKRSDRERETCVARPIVVEEERKPEHSGAKKRKLGRRYGGNSFWPCGR